MFEDQKEHFHDEKLDFQDDEQFCFQCGKSTYSGIRVFSQDGAWTASVCERCITEMMDRSES